MRSFFLTSEDNLMVISELLLHMLHDDASLNDRLGSWLYQFVFVIKKEYQCNIHGIFYHHKSEKNVFTSYIVANRI